MTCLTPAAGNTYISLLGFSRAIDYTSHDGYFYRFFYLEQDFLHFPGYGGDIDLGPAADRAAYHDRAVLSQVETLQYLVGGGNLLTWVAVRETRMVSPRPSFKRIPSPTLLLMRPLGGGPASVMPMCSG